MVNKRLKRKPYTSPAVEVLWMHSDAHLMESSVTVWTPDQEPYDPDEGFGGNAKRFDFANIYDVDGISDGLELEFDYSGF